MPNASKFYIKNRTNSNLSYRLLYHWSRHLHYIDRKCIYNKNCTYQKKICILSYMNQWTAYPSLIQFNNKNYLIVQSSYLKFIVFLNKFICPNLIIFIKCPRLCSFGIIDRSIFNKKEQRYKESLAECNRVF